MYQCNSPLVGRTRPTGNGSPTGSNEFLTASALPDPVATTNTFLAALSTLWGRFRTIANWNN